MNNLRLSDSNLGDSLEAAVRRFLAPMAWEGDTSALKMRIDVAEKDNAYEVKADLPGVNKEDINIRIDGDMVQIDAEVKHEKETRGQGDKVLRSERYRGRITRSFSLGQHVDEDNAKARYADGVLTLDLPKKNSPSARKVEVQ